MSPKNDITLDIFSQYSNFSFDAFSFEELANLYIDISKPTFSWLFGKYSSCLRLGGSRILKFCHLVHIDSDFTPSVPKQIIDEYFSSDPKKLIDSLQLYADARMTSYTLLKNYLGDFLPRFFGMDIKLIPYRYIVEHKLILSGANLSEFNLAQLPIKETNIVELWESYPLLNTLYSFRYSRLKDLYYDATYKNSIRSFASSLENLLSSENVLADISVENGYAYVGDHGAGHFVKMVHNGIEYGMMQALAEGFDVLKNSEFNLNFENVMKPYKHGSVIESRLVNWLADAFKKYGDGLETITDKADHLGEGEWTIKVAKEMGIEVKVIEDAFKARINSQSAPNYQAQIISALRGEFGGHPVLKKDNTVTEDASLE